MEIYTESRKASMCVWSRYGQRRKDQERRLRVNEMRMVRWMCVVTKKDTIGSEHVRGSVKVARATKKITKINATFIKWHGHEKGRSAHVLRRMLN